MMKRHLIHLLMAVLFLAACTSSVILMYNFSDKARLGSLAMSAKKNEPIGQCSLTIPQGHADSSLLKKDNSPVTADDVKQIVIDGKIYDIPLDMEKILSDFDYIIDRSAQTNDSDRYTLSITLYREDLMILHINCYSDVKSPSPSEIEFSSLDLNLNGGVVQSRYMPELIIGGMDVRNVKMEEYLRLTGQEDAEYIFTSVPFDNPDGTQTVFALSTISYTNDPGSILYGVPFIRGIRYGRDIELNQKAWMVRTEYSLPEGDISLPEKVPYQTFMKTKGGEPITADELPYAQYHAYEYDMSLYELMKLLDEKGLSTEFKVFGDSAAYVYEYDGTEYICVGLISDATGSSLDSINVYVKAGDPVLAGTVVKMEDVLYQLLEE